MVTVAVSLPSAFSAVTTYGIAYFGEVGVPLIPPVEVLKARPVLAVRFGVIDHDVAGDPLLEGVTVVIGDPTV
jgi:hypothetical protein